jgi:hypothetical protein
MQVSSAFLSGRVLSPAFPARLGQADAGQAWFGRAKAAIAKYDGLVERARHVARPEVSKELLNRYQGSPSNPVRNVVAYIVAETESRVPIDYSVFLKSEVQERVQKLEEWNRKFEADVTQAERLYGILASSPPVERGGEGAPEIPVTLIVVAAAAAVLVGMGFLVFGGK